MEFERFRLDTKENFFPKRVSLWDRALERWSISLLGGFKPYLNKAMAAPGTLFKQEVGEDLLRSFPTNVSLDQYSGVCSSRIDHFGFSKRVFALKAWQP